MATLKEKDGGYIYDDNGFEITLDQKNFCGFQHRKAACALIDLVTVDDPRDGLKFTHWRYSQPPEVFEQMLALTQSVGTYILRETPMEDIENIFMNMYGPRDDEIEQLLGGDDE